MIIKFLIEKFQILKFRNCISKANTFFKILNKKNNDENFVNLYFKKSLLYLNPLINF